MKKTIIFLLLTFGIFGHTFAQQIILTDSTRFSLLTCSPGPAGYEKFGHTAIRILDASQSLDVAANWGLFNFDEPGFYPKFIKGETYYLLGIQQTFYFLISYERRNSSVTEQVLNLTRKEKQKLLDIILTNYQPENRRYLYNFVFDNCATRPRDILNETLAPKIIESAESAENKSFRQWVSDYAGKSTWMQFGIDLVFGRDADKEASPFQTMFLPEELSRRYDDAYIVDEMGLQVPLVTEKKILVEKVEKEEPTSYFFLHPFFVTSLIFVLGILLCIYDYKRKKQSRWFDFLLLLTTGIVGLVIAYLWFFSIHPLVKNNYNILWCNPLNILLAVIYGLKTAYKFLKYAQIMIVALSLLSLILAISSLQVLNVAFIPIISLILIRALYDLKYRKTIY